MTEKNSTASRRDFIKTTGTAAVAGSILAGSVPNVHAGEDGTIQLALIGCGGRGTGAAANALLVPSGNTKLVAMADVFDHRLNGSYQNLSKKFGEKVTVSEDHKFIGFDGYQKAMDLLRPGDVVILGTPPAFRWLMYGYAIEKGLNVFMEKPVTVDAPTSVRMLELNEKAKQKNLKVGVGLMCRHCEARGELFNRIQDGELGDLTLLRAYRMAGPTGSAATGPMPKGQSELLYQISRFHAFLWLSGGAVSDFLIHNIDECCWMKNDWPVEAIASGGRHYRGEAVDQNFDSYSIEYTFADGAKMIVGGRTMPGCFHDFATYAHGTKNSAIVSSAGHAPARCRIFKGQKLAKDAQIWQYDKREPSPYQLEWNNLIDAIKNDKLHNEAERGIKASLVTSLGRFAAHTGQKVTYDEFLKNDHEFAPDLANLKLDSKSPLLADANGKYPIPLPGIQTYREY